MTIIYSVISTLIMEILEKNVDTVKDNQEHLKEETKIKHR